MIGEREIRAHEARRAASSTTRAARWSISTRWRPRSGTSIWRGAAVDVFPIEPGSNAEQVRHSAAGPRQRHPDAARRRLDGGGAGAHRRGGRAQVRRLLRQRLDHRRGELPAGAAAAAVLRHALHPRASQRARRARPAQRRVRPAPHQHRRAVLPDRQPRSATSCWTWTGGVQDAARLLADIRAIPGTISARLCLSRSSSRTFLISTLASTVWLRPRAMQGAAPGFSGTAGGRAQPPRDFATALRHAAQRGRKGFEPAAKVAASGSKPGSGD